MRAALLALAALCASPAIGQVEVPRRVLVLYRASQIPGDVKDPFFLNLHQHAEMPLNWLGLEAEYVDVEAGLPAPAKLSGARGVLLWPASTHAFEDPRPVCRWLSAAMRGGARVVLLGQLGLQRKGAPPPEELDPECRETLSTLGVSYRGLYYADPLGTEIALQHPIVGFERKPDPTEHGTVSRVRLAAGSTTYLRLILDHDATNPTEPVGVTPRGAVALDPFLLYSNEQISPARYAWVIDPFVFFAAAFAVEGLPRPDPTTLNGRRMYMSHVDGDGFFNLAEFDRRKLSGQVYVDEFLAKRPDSPFTMSLIAGYYDMALYQDPDSIRLSRAAMDRRNVEPAVHGYAHPLIWRTGAAALKLPGYRVSAMKETAGAAKIIDERILPPGKTVGLMLWTGDCLPGADAVLAAERAGLLNLNGGGGRIDALHPSVAYLMPLSRRVGGARQLYAPANNENEFTNLWSGPYYGYRDAIVTFERSGAPRRLKPVDVYVHFYSAEKHAALGALRKVYDWAYAQPLTPVFAGAYARAARDFFAMRVVRLGPRRFRLEGGPDLRTVRFDDEAGEPDLAVSSGVIGFRRELGSLYVHLDGSARREVALSPRPPRRPYLEQANFEVDAWEPRRDGARFMKRGWWTSECVLAGLTPGKTYKVSGAGLETSLPADAAGRLTLSFPDSERGGPARQVLVE
ncbi:MAG: hypothetical protein HYZ75_08395 [Elusimicrobia bacterium]|nr:hypothetical protein [Elusimicrobiota bacterium]